jgi:hypothetical protein
VYNAAGCSGCVLLMGQTNLYDEQLQGEQAIDFRDYAELISICLEKTYWLW